MADTGKLQAFAAGGPSAASDYEAAKSDVSGLKQQALTDASNRSGALYAPEAFKASQQAMIGNPFDAAISGLGAQQATAGAYSGALNAAQGKYMSDLAASKPLVEGVTAAKAQAQYADALNDAQTYVRRTNADAEKAKAQSDKQSKDFKSSQKEFARQDASLDDSVDSNTYQAIADLLKTADDLPTAVKLLQGAPRDDQGNLVDKSGDVVNEQQIMKYLNQALAEHNDNSAATGLHVAPNGNVGTLSAPDLSGPITDPNQIAAFKALYG